MILSGLTDEEAHKLLYDWRFWARPDQLEPSGDWFIWLILAGRGFGKTRSGAEWVRYRVEECGARRIALIGETAADVRDVMVEGEAGLLATSPPWNKPHYEPSKRRLTWPNGAVATTFSGDAPDQLRGPQHDTAWTDEPAKWKYLEDAWSNMEFGLRLGDPRCVATTTPRPLPLIKQLIADPRCHITRGNTYANKANLAATFIDRIKLKYEGTRLGRQELHAEVLDDMPGALWTHGLVDRHRRAQKDVPEMRRIVVAIDPATRGDETDEDLGTAETGLVVAGLGVDGHGYLLADQSNHMSPGQWGKRAVNLWKEYRADRIVAERNNGGDMVGHVILMEGCHAFSLVWASRGKIRRAEPIAALYEQGLIHHVGAFGPLEDQLCTYTSDSTTLVDRLDALVWAFTELMLDADEFPHYDKGKHVFKTPKVAA